MKIAIAFDLRSQAEGGDALPLARSAGDFELQDAEEEFDSPETIQAIRAVLESAGHEVELLGSGPRALRRLLDGPPPELVFNLAEGSGTSRCREAYMPAMLEMLGVPFTGSDALVLASTLDKDCAKRLVAAAGVTTPNWVLVRDDEVRGDMQALRWPRFVKPAFEGSSKGILATSLVRTPEELEQALVRTLGTYRQPVLVEEFIDGRELTVAVLGEREPEVLGILEVVPREKRGPFVYDLAVKRDWRRRVRYEAPPELSSAAERNVRAAALAVYRCLGCRDLARLDFRLASDEPYFLEVNPLPGLSPETGDVVFLARGYGVSYAELVLRIVDEARKRLERNGTISAGATAR
jgi:D-alanine-D-alanine ligase